MAKDDTITAVRSSQSAENTDARLAFDVATSQRLSRRRIIIAFLLFNILVWILLLLFILR
jgi:hypothetical protein